MFANKEEQLLLIASSLIHEQFTHTISVAFLFIDPNSIGHSGSCEKNLLE
jgi:hypothetical protein